MRGDQTCRIETVESQASVLSIFHSQLSEVAHELTGGEGILRTPSQGFLLLLLLSTQIKQISG